ncbi:hypothetical protein [Shewanella waksmanii]|uniref:hypothetical protein n=1 Tax=Shewanella waksmanii TaxID=213783 RepID=UPI003736553E
MFFAIKRGSLTRWDGKSHVGFIEPDDGTEPLMVAAKHLEPIDYLPKVGDRVAYLRTSNTQHPLLSVRAQIDNGEPIRLSRYKRQIFDVDWLSKMNVLLAVLLTVGMVFLSLNVEYNPFVGDRVQPPEGLFPAGSEHYVGKTDTSDMVFECQGKTQCMQMTSCGEAKHYVAHCPNMQTQVGSSSCLSLWCINP